MLSGYFQPDCPRRPEECKIGRKHAKQSMNKVVFFLSERMGSGRREVLERGGECWQTTERQQQRKLWGRRTRKAADEKILQQKKEEVLLAKENVLILCSWNRYLKKHCKTFVFNSLILRVSQVAQWFKKKQSACQCSRHRRRWFDPWAGKISWRRKWWPTPVFLPEESHGQRRLAGYSPWGRRVRHDWATDLAGLNT